MSNKFCRFLSNGWSISQNKQGTIVKPCCWFDDNTPLTGPTSLDHLHKIDSWIPACGLCEQQEKSGIQSFRQSSFDIIPDIDNGKPVAIDINLDFNCNAACIICNPGESTLWQKEFNKKQIVYNIAPTLTTNSIDTILNNLDLSAVKRIKFFGGEPLFTDLHCTVLSKIQNPECVEVWYTTNGSIYPKPEVLELWSRFKLIFVEASIDAVGDQFNYIRWPLVWKKVENNLLRLINEAPTNVLFRVNHTLNPFNVFYYSRLQDWVEKNFAANRLGDVTEINVHPCWGIWDLAKTPTVLRNQINQDSIVGRLLLNTPVDNNLNSIKNFINVWEERRQNSWKESFPEIIEYFKELD